MILRCPRLFACGMGAPRAGGDDPSELICLPEAAWCAPRAGGDDPWSVADIATLEPVVLPAQAGMIR